MSLGSAINGFGSIVEQSRGGDSQAAQLELLHDIEQQLRLGPVDEVKAGQATLEKHLTAALLQGPAPPLRHMISSSFVQSYARGNRQGLYTTVTLLLSWMGNKSSPASSVASKIAICVLLGDLSRVHGGAMVALCQDTIGLLIKMLRAPEMPVRVAACSALAASLEGSGGVDDKLQQEALKNLKHVLGERGAPVELRQACVTCCPALIAYSEGLWAGDLVEQLCTLLIKHLDDASPPVRLAAAHALGESCVLAMSHPFNTAAKGKAGKTAAKPKVQLNKMFEAKKTEPT